MAGIFGQKGLVEDGKDDTWCEVFSNTAYIAYDRTAYGDFLKLKIPFKYLRSETLTSEKDKSDDIQNSGTTGRAWLKCDNTGKKLADVPLECTKQAADAKEYHERRLIVLGSVSG